MQNRYPFFITCPRNFEKLLAHELIELGISQVKPGRLGVYTQLNREEVYKVVYLTRIGSRVLRPVYQFFCPNAETLYSECKEISWEKMVLPGRSIVIDVSVTNTPGLTHSQYAVQKMKDGLCDYLRDLGQGRPTVDREDADIKFHLHVQGSQATISLNYSGGVAHRRGYRQARVEAPLKENLAAGILRFSAWDKERPFVDLFTGSGTFLIEAQMLAQQIPAGYFKQRQGFERLKDFQAEVWEKVKASCDSRRCVSAVNSFMGVDWDLRALASAQKNLTYTGLLPSTQLVNADATVMDTLPPNAVIFANPPYGARLESNEDNLPKLYSQLGTQFKEVWHCNRAVILFPNASLRSAFEKNAGQAGERVLELDNGGLKIEVVVYFTK